MGLPFGQLFCSFFEPITSSLLDLNLPILVGLYKPQKVKGYLLSPEVV